MKVREITLGILTKYKKMETLCEALDTCWDLYENGYVETELEQKVWEDLAESSALTLWAMYTYANNGLEGQDFECVFKEFVENIEEGYHGENNG